MEKKGGGKVRANKIKVWQKEMILDNQSSLATLIARPTLRSMKELMTILHLILVRHCSYFAKIVCQPNLQLLVTKNIRNEIKTTDEKHPFTRKPVRLTLDRNPTSVNDEAMAVTYANGAIEPKVEEKKQQINKAAEKEIQELEELLRCKVCLDCDACIVFFPCRHMVTCESCEGFLQSCPVCRSVIEEAVKINEE